MPSDRSRHRHSTSGAGAGRRPSTSSTTSSRSSRSSIGASVFDHPGAHYYQSSRYSVYTELSSIPSEYPQEQLEPDAAVDDLRDLHVFCEFAQLLNCTQTFRGNEFDQWWAHTISHLGNRFPEQSGCPFCSNRFFNSTMSGNAGAAFDARLLHVWEHLVKGGVTEADLRPDYQLYQFMYKHGLVSLKTYNDSLDFMPHIPNPDHDGQTMPVLFPNDVWKDEDVVVYSHGDRSRLRRRGY
ncbi:uncharacterized protein B0I36DRAFT_343893 [Microdochium trichocladiopsis]|uniref:Uncharacterized protein n=1 Tax=Microdochium trichocladiopsis TaxID=1682393 RepID=A0A9P9BZG9_9PEZI|nr:uncharacterized protein B0I36DRAFT_343893 [Microdochium trichocladiopsis]KAH7040094.1 hypothetical protein B0I36DRAFT_343893 [Microdochium trichocladiopsis]